MNPTIEEMSAALDHISGFHQYVLTAPYHLGFASASLARMVGRKIGRAHV